MLEIAVRESLLRESADDIQFRDAVPEYRTAMPGHHGSATCSPDWPQRLPAPLKRPSRPEPSPGRPKNPQNRHPESSPKRKFPLKTNA